ncbi:MAG: hypothetical protein QOI26_661, partial [Pseudonocardiales bacterium]|nr:hypothetical protein [Pseudonocardiales bacterium]
RVAELATDAGLVEQARLVRAPGEGQTVPQACIPFRKLAIRRPSVR